MSEFEVEGLKEAKKDLKVRSKRDKDKLNGVLDDSLSFLKTELESHAPDDQYSDNDMKLYEGFREGVDSSGSPIVYIDKEVVDRALYTNYGTIHQEPQNFLEKAQDKFYDELRERINREFGG